MKFIIISTRNATSDIIHYIIQSRAILSIVFVLSDIRFEFSKAVASRDVRALFNEFNVSLTILYCLLTTQYSWFLTKNGSLTNLLDDNVLWIHLFQSVYYILTPTIIEINSVFVGENLDISENLNDKMFNHSFSYLKLSLAEKVDRFKTLFDC